MLTTLNIFTPVPTGQDGVARASMRGRIATTTAGTGYRRPSSPPREETG